MTTNTIVCQLEIGDNLSRDLRDNGFFMELARSAGALPPFPNVPPCSVFEGTNDNQDTEDSFPITEYEKLIAITEYEKLIAILDEAIAICEGNHYCSLLSTGKDGVPASQPEREERRQ